MLLRLFYPPLEYFALWAHGNWDIACMKGMMAIGIFCDNHPLFDRAVDFCGASGMSPGITTTYKPASRNPASAIPAWPP